MLEALLSRAMSREDMQHFDHGGCLSEGFSLGSGVFFTGFGGVSGLLVEVHL